MATHTTMPARKSFLDLAFQSYYKIKKLIEIREKAIDKTMEIFMHAADKSKVDMDVLMGANFDMYYGLYKKVYFYDDRNSKGDRDKFMERVKNKFKGKAIDEGTKSVIDFFNDVT